MGESLSALTLNAIFTNWSPPVTPIIVGASGDAAILREITFEGTLLPTPFIAINFTE